MKGKTQKPKARLPEPTTDLEEQARSRLIGFDKDKAIAAILYLAKRLEVSDKLSIAKALYFADKYHLNHYFRFVLGDVYARMPKGPAPSSTLDLLNEGIEEQFKIENHKVIPLKEPDMDEFSRSDIIALNYALEFCKEKTGLELSKDSHDDIYHHNDSHMIEISDFIEDAENAEGLKKALMM